MNIPRKPLENILARLRTDNRVVILFGPRQSGKTSLSKRVIAETGLRWLCLNGDNPEDSESLTHPSDARLRGLIGAYEGLFVDEAQRIPDIGLTLKRVHDQYPAVKLLVTGSSSLEIGDKTREALTGRTWTFSLFPIAALELAMMETPFESGKRLDELLVFGSYPALFSLSGRQDKIAHLKELCGAYLYKDVLELSGIRNSRKIRDLLRLLAYQVGAEVSFHELGSQCGLSTDTVISYIDLLEKSFVLFRLGAWSSNLRKEVVKKCKVYFADNGVRNTVIDDFKEPALRGDVGSLWENFLVSERRKRNAYLGAYGSAWFWRLQTGAEIDYVENADGRMSAYEFKWSKKNARLPASFAAAYPDHRFQVIDRDNWLEFVTADSI